MRYLPHTKSDIDAMLQAIGKPSIDALFDSIPKPDQLDRPLAMPEGQHELSLKRELSALAGQAPKASFLGAGCTPHFVPSMVDQQLLRSEWYTAYTPYQPEVAQGTLQAIFEFQTMAADLLGCEIANASMYDGATAFVEALLMATRIHRKGTRIVLVGEIHPEYVAVAQNYLGHTDLMLEHVARTADGTADLAGLDAALDAGDVACVAYQTPNYLGLLEPQRAIIERAKAKGAVVVAANAEPVALSLVEAPGTAGADIVVSEGIGLCGHTSLGAPGVGLFATAKKHVRQMPGRLAGATVDAAGERGFVLTLSTREQHIRRERATSNICTNHGLMALAFSMALSLYGKEGFVDLGKLNIARTLHLRSAAKAAGLDVAFTGPHFNETVLRFESEAALQTRLDALAADDVFAGVPLGKTHPDLAGHLLVSTTELHTTADIDALVAGLAG